MDVRTEELGHIGVVMGGCSSEKEISLKSGNAIYQALKEQGCRVSSVVIETTREEEIIATLKSLGIDIAFLALHGSFGEDGGIQEILERRQIVYTGSDAKASRLAMNKVLTQKMLAEKGIPVPKYCVVTKEDVFDSEKAWDVLEGGPVVVKPAAEGSSIGVSIVQQKDQLAAAVDLAFQYGTEVLLEKFISGREMTVGILDEQALPLVEIRPGNSFFDFTAKYQKGMTEYIVPAEVSKEQSERIQGIALEVYKFLGCRDFARLDFMLDAQGNPYFLEVNTIPGFTSTSLLPMAVNEKGIGFGELCLMIARLAAKRKQAGAAKGTS